MEIPFVEKYRPKTFREIVGQDLTDLEKYMERPFEMPHILLVNRSPGTGKTSTAKVIASMLGADTLVLNSSDERKMEVIRGRVKDFAGTKSMNDKSPKIIIFDEADGMLEPSQNALRAIMEKYALRCKFIFTANNKEKIIAPILSRCMVIEMKNISKSDILTKLKYICTQESISYKEEPLNCIINEYYPDMRSMIGEIQRRRGGIVESIIPNSLENQFYERLINKSMSMYDCGKFFLENGMNMTQTLIYVQRKCLENNINISAEIFAEIDYRRAVGCLDEIQIMYLVETIKKKIVTPNTPQTNNHITNISTVR